MPSAVGADFRHGAILAAAVVTGWLGWAATATVLGNWSFGPEGTNASFWHVAKMFGLAHAPGLIRLLGVVDTFGPAPAILAFGGQALAMAIVIQDAYGLRRLHTGFAVLAVAAVPWLILQTGIVLLVLPRSF
jgi:hypothetical protein